MASDHSRGPTGQPTMSAPDHTAVQLMSDLPLGAGSPAADWHAPLTAVTQQMPDAQERLQYVGQMTERAAHKVLGIVEQAQPLCRELGSHCQAAALAIQGPLANEQSSTADLRVALEGAMAALKQASTLANAQTDALTEIMVTQDFQDLSGQVIKHVNQIISTAHANLLGMLNGHPESAVPAAAASAALAASAPNACAQALEGPQVPDKALAQGDVDDLLASLGF
jgi:chemotaxis protein CheZ